MVEGETFGTLRHWPSQHVTFRDKKTLWRGSRRPDCGILAWRRVLELTRYGYQWEVLM